MATWSGAEAAPAEPACPLCHGAGFIHPLLASGKPDYGQVVPCRCNRPGLDKERQDGLARYSNIGLLSRFTFENLSPEGRSGDPQSQALFRRAYEAARAFAAAPKGWLIFTGPSNSGKTHLAVAIANERLRLGHTVFYISAPDLLDRMRAGFSPGSETPYDEFFSQVRSAPLLVLDDLGAQTSTPWAKEKLDQLLNFRFNSQLPTVIVAIVPLEQFEERLRTRLTNSDLCRVLSLEKQRDSAQLDWPPELKLQRSMTFDNFDWRRVNLPAEQRQNLEAAFRLALDFARAPEGWLVFMGETGCGKTHLAAAIVNYRYQGGQPASFIVVPELLDHLRSTFSPESKTSFDELFEGVKTAPLLVMDDFGEQSTTPWAREKLYQVISYRYNAKLPTVITTRYSLEQIMERIDGSISSRLVDHKFSTPFNITAPDYRGNVDSVKSPSAKKGRFGRQS